MPDKLTPRELLFDWEHAFEQRFNWFIAVGLAAILLGGLLLIILRTGQERLPGEARTELFRRYRAWLALTLGLFIPVYIGAGPTILAIGVLSLLCYRDYARATGLFREKIVSIVVVVTLLAITLAVLDNWYWLCVALTPLSLAVLGAVTLLADRPKGYIQRVGLAVLAVVLFGTCLAHAGYLAQLPTKMPYRPVVLWLLVTSLSHPLLVNVTRRLAGPVLLPNTAPSQTLFSTAGTILLTTALAAFLGTFAFHDTALAGTVHPLVLGLIIAVVSQFSDLMLAAVRRDLGISEPTTGRLLDRVRGLILTAPIVYCYVNYYASIGADRQVRILSGG